MSSIKKFTGPDEKAIWNDASKDAQALYHPPLSETMRINIAVKQDGKMVIYHSSPLPDLPAWVDFDADDGTTTINYHDGRSQMVGYVLPEAMRTRQKNADLCVFTRLKAGIIQSVLPVKMAVRQLN